MKQNCKPLKIAKLAAIMALSMPVSAMDRPKTMEDMWNIIQAQQKQIDEMKAGMAPAINKATAATTTTNFQSQDNKADNSNVQIPENKVVVSNVKKLERKTDILSQEVEKLRTNLAIPEEKQLKSAYGLGPAASKIYQAGKGLSIGGYGEAFYQNFVGDKGDAKNNADLERAVLYVGYKFTDRILFNSEIEFEHATTGEGDEQKGEVSVEFASLDFFIDPRVNARAGLVLMPMGFINRIHEPLFFFGNHRPVVEQLIIPTTWREMGLGLFGAITPELTYTAYVVNGLNAKGFSSDGIREGRGGGSQGLANNLGYVAQMNYQPAALPGVTVGGGAYVGNSGQDQEYAGQKPNVFTQLYEAHVQWKYRGLEFRTLGSWGHINNAGTLSAANGKTIGSQNYGWYSEVGYDVLPLIFKDTQQYLAPFFRHEKYNTIASAPQGFAGDPRLNQRILQVGLQYKPIPQVVIKADYRNFSAEEGPVPDDFNLGFGYIF
ncbi:MAG: hypothetical protein PHY54_09290 [Methylococcales bacterium]|nr:hypothetical protein [Methylococcales bacterium]